MRSNPVLVKFLVLGILESVSTRSYVIHVDVSKHGKHFNHFWESTGLCPPLPHNKADQYDLSNDQHINLAYVSSVPHSGIKQVRIHWLLDLITVGLDEGKPKYNFTNLDAFMNLLKENGLIPGFELMGSPSDYFNDFEDKKQVLEWKELITAIGKRYIDQYGLKHVSRWNFETWNEPDNHDFDNVNMTIKGFLNYYDACSEGLKEASLLLKFGGPGDSCRPFPKSPICWNLLNHCYNGTNYFSGETGVRLDYIALHKKGAGSSLHILEQEMETIGEIHKRFPNFISIPIYNDEADPLVGWSIPQRWRADVTYAAMVVKVITQHQNAFLSNGHGSINYTLLSNDNAFMSYYPHHFTQRTLTARFQMNDTKPPHVQMARKPVLTVMGLLALLGDKQIAIDVENNEEKTDDIVGAIATIHEPAEMNTSDSWQASIIIYSSDDNRTSSSLNCVMLNLTHFPRNKGLVYVTYFMDNNFTNPFLEWSKLGSPDFPTIKQFQQIRKAEDPVVQNARPFPEEGNLLMKVELPIPSVFLIHICAQPNSPPNQVTSVRLIGLTKGQVAVVWKDEYLKTKCLKTFEVEFSPDATIYRRINAKDTIFTLFVYSPESMMVSGFYRVCAVDYWDKPGLYSLPVKYRDIF
ncbi:alpha-L-iduronidase [Ambystoma mexicanum]|uniref:alpha-L-iduronidase n=1 Tax=Ambystoma mexicanum TaxID=8296 RepID=UPI0037E73F89